MTDSDLACALAHAIDIERHARARWEVACRQLETAERVAAMDAMRQARALQRSLEQWITGRALRVAYQT